MTGRPALLALLLLQATSLPGQTPNNTVEIQVGDRYGAIIPDAQILVAGFQGGVPFSTRTNADGKANFDLPSGEFDIVIQIQGFKPAEADCEG
jgi:carboxypeptidase family protein